MAEQGEIGDAHKSEAMGASNPHVGATSVSQAPLRFDVTGSATFSTSYSLDSTIAGEMAIQIPSSSFSSSIQSSPASFPSLPSLNSRASVSLDQVHCPISTSQGSPLSVSEELADIWAGFCSEDSHHRQQNDMEAGTLPWLQALELYAVGACRTDERLKPVIRWNVSCFGANGRLLGRLGLHFKAKELTMLARCLCAPLVSLRVGKVSRHGPILHPTTRRGHLNLTISPSSALCLSFIEDSGSLERLAEMTPSTEDPPIVLEAISADTSSRTFMLKLPDNRIAFFWQSEKIKATGDELLLKMRDFLLRRPTLSELTGIPESRLVSFASLVSTASSNSSVSSTTRTLESAIVPATTGCTLSAGRQASQAAAINVVSALPTMGVCIAPETTTTTIASTTTTTSAAFGGEAVGLVTGDGSRLEMDRNAFAQRLLGSLPRTIVPFPLLVSSSTTGSLLPTSRMLPASTPPLLTTTPCYCPCPLANVSAFTFTPPFLPSLPTAAAATEAAEPPSVAASPLLTDLYSLEPLFSSSSASVPFVSISQCLDDVLLPMLGARECAAASTEPSRLDDSRTAGASAQDCVYGTYLDEESKDV